MTSTTNPAADPITLEVVRNKLEGIANEMQSTLVRSSFSPIVKEGLDASASLFTLEGETLAQATAIPIHLATLIPVVQTVIGKFPVGGMREGDVYIMNDPYHGGTHLPDIALVMPIFFRGRPIAFSAAMTHHQDVGGMSPGSVPPNATGIYQEGIRIPPLKYRDGGTVNRTLVDLLTLNVRVPETFMGDLNAQVAACSIGARCVGQLAERYGSNHLPALAEELLGRSERLARRAIERLPDGRYHYVPLPMKCSTKRRRIVRHLASGSLMPDFRERRVLGEEEIIPSKTLVRLRPGDRVEVNTAGGGGYGDPGARAVDRLAADLAGGKVGEAAWIRAPGAPGATVGDD